MSELNCIHTVTYIQFTYPDICRSQRPLRLVQAVLTSWGRGYSGCGASGVTSAAQGVIRGAVRGRQGEEGGDTDMAGDGEGVWRSERSIK